MAEPFDTLAEQAITIFEALIAGSTEPAEAIPELSALYEALSLNSGTYEGVKAVLGRVRGMYVVDGPPSDFLGTVGSTAFDPENRIYYGPKDAVTGWPAGVAFVDEGPQGETGPQGPSGTITSVTAVTGVAGSSASVTLGGTPQARTMEFNIPRGDKGDTGADTGSIAMAVMERSDLYGLETIGQAAAFAGRATELDLSGDYERVGLEVVDNLLDLTNITVTRATGGYAPKLDGTYEWFGANVPRLTDWGLTAEKASTNLFPRAAPTVAQLATATNTAAASEPAGAPISGLTWLNLDNTAGKTAIAYQSVGHTPSVEHRMSAFVYCPDGVAPVPSTSSSSGDFTFVIAGQITVTGIIVERVGSSNFWRCSCSYTVNAAPSGYSGLIRYSGQNSRTMHFSIQQIEVGSRATSPIITTGSTATRAADVVLIDGLDYDTPFVLFSEFAFTGAPSNIGAGTRTVLELSAPGDNNRANLTNIGGAVGGQLVAGGTDQGQPSVAGTVAINSMVSVALLVQPNRLIVAKEGVLSAADTSATMPSVSLSRLNVGSRSDGTNQLGGVISRLLVLPLPRPANDTLPQAMTA